MKGGQASGFQIAFFTIAVTVLCLWINRTLRPFDDFPPDVASLWKRVMPLLFGVAILLAFPALRRYCRDELNKPLPADSRPEVITLGMAHVLTALAWAGGLALVYWWLGGESLLARFMAGLDRPDELMQRSLSPLGVAKGLILPVLVAPIIEELVFRGLLYRAWERQWGWLPAMFATSAVFAFYHQNAAPAFMGSIIYVCILRRTGTLWGPIMAHAIYNTLVWYPLLGQLLFPRDAIAPGDLSSWNLQLAGMLITAVALPAYVWMARHKREPVEDFPPTVVDAAVSK